MNQLLNSSRKNISVLAEEDLTKVVGGYRGYGRHHGGGKPSYGGGGGNGGGMSKPRGNNGMRRFNGGGDVTINVINVNIVVNQVFRGQDA